MTKDHEVIPHCLKSKNAQARPNRVSERLITWQFDRDEDLRLLDKLGYARAAVAPPALLAERLDLDSFGPDALDQSFRVDVLARQLGKRRGVLKTILLNQPCWPDWEIAIRTGAT
jgi:formamidopyrimidine-DNA glycosylase